MKNQKDQKDYQLTQKDEEIYSNQQDTNKGRNRSAGHNRPKDEDRVAQVKFSKSQPNQNKEKKPLPNGEQVSRFINEGNPNIQPINSPQQVKEENQKSQPVEEGAPVQKYNPFSSRPDFENNHDSSGSSTGFADHRDIENTERTEQPELTDIDSHEAQLIKEDILEDASLAEVKETIYVTIENGVATLSGKVATDQQKITAGNKAIARMGNGKVNNYINVMYSDDR